MKPAVPGTPIRREAADDDAEAGQRHAFRKTGSGQKSALATRRHGVAMPSTMPPISRKIAPLAMPWLNRCTMDGGQAVHRIEGQPERDVADLADAGIGEQALQVVLEDGDGAGAEHGDQRQPSMICGSGSLSNTRLSPNT
jgi:hypothetical protein